MTNNERLQPIIIEDTRLIFRNFSGKEGKYNREGDRNFGVILDSENAETLLSLGWNVKYLNPRDESEQPQAYLPVSVSYRSGSRPPRVMMITSRARTPLGEDEIDILDWADIKKADVKVNPYEWSVNGKNGVKAYLASIYVTIEEDELDLKYADIPEDRAHKHSVEFEEPNY